MKVAVFGCGYLGAVHAACMASLGHEVIGVDVIDAQVAALSDGHAPFHEPGFPELLQSALETGRLHFTTDAGAAADATVHFICVGTPQRKGENAADVSYVDSATDSILQVLKPGDVVVGKSTVPVGTAARLADAGARHRATARTSCGTPSSSARATLSATPWSRIGWCTA